MAKKKKTTKKDTVAKSNPWVVATIVLGSLLFISLIANAILGTLLSVQTTTTQPSAPSEPTGGTQAPPTQGGGDVSIDLDTAHVLGNPDADVVMVEYSSFTCPFCGRYHAETFSDVQSNFVDTGDVFYAYKHFVRNADDARIANFAECAAEQDEFFGFINQVYANQNNLGNAALRGYADNLGLDMAEFDSCVESGRNEEIANAHLQEARANGISGTPSFLINGERLVGAQPYSVFASALESAN